MYDVISKVVNEDPRVIGKVQFQYEKIDEVAQVAASQSDATAQMRQRLLQQLQVLEDGGWIGEGAKTFFNEMHGLMLPAVARLETVFDELSAVLRRASDAMREAEEQAAGLFRGEGGGALNGGGSGGSGGGGSGGGSGGTGGGGSGGSQSAIAKGIDVLSKLLGIGDDGAGLLKGLFKNVDKFGEFSEKFKLGPVGDVLSIVAVGVENWGKPDFFEKIGDKTVSVGLEMLLTKNPYGAAVMVISDINQLVGQGGSFVASQINEGVNDPGLGDSIKNFDTTISNADAGGVLDSVGTVGVDFVQAHVAGLKEIWNNPTPLNIAQALMPGGLANVGLASDPALAKEMAQNSAVMLGTAADFVVGVVQLPSAYIDLGENSLRVGLHEAGLSQGASETISSALGTAADLAMFGINPIGTVVGHLPTVDLSGFAKSLFD
ncbi:MAG: WXG100 family type VII secretion target [Chloroflexi bacterium]|nr:WXG100 family type VII secretion target [Chloroflexota bacterium]